MVKSEEPIVTATVDYERWLKKHVAVVETDLQLKHKEMTTSLFAFLRATFYRWASLWPEVCADLTKTPRVLAVGDLHVENFGTWRDAEGRLVWGVNDFDEVARMPYAVDLTRLVTSAILAKRENRLAIDPGEAATAVLEGYSEYLEEGGNPFILEERHPNLRAMALGAERDPTRFWSKLIELPSVSPPKAIRRLLKQSLPDDAKDITFSHRIAGVGSLGRPRYVATAFCSGGLAAREAKAWLPSAWGWVSEPTEGSRLFNSAAKAVGSTEGPLLCRRAWMGRAPDRPALWKNRTGTVPKASGRAAYPAGYGTRDSKSSLSDP